jgi:molybdopterin/thiamine biosynthesis adenylyltransferase
LSFDRRYFSRQLVLDGFGAKAQKRLAGSHALVAGLGGTGCVAAVNVALAGVGHLSLLDRDVVSVENLHRQPIYTNADVGMSKAEVAARFLSERAPRLKVDYHTESLDRSNAFRLLGGADLALDCLDNMEARHALNEACVRRQVPLVHTGGIGWEASAAVFWSPRAACLECLVPAAADEQELPSCEEVGVLGAVTSYAASVGALEAVKLLAGIPPSLAGRMLFFDGRTGDSRVVDLEKRESCGVCGSGSRPPGGGGRVVQLCGDGEFYVSRAFPSRSFSVLARKLRADARAMGDSIILIAHGRAEVSLFRGGGALVKGVSSGDEAREILRDLGVGR